MFGNLNSLYPREFIVQGRLVRIVYLDINADYTMDNNQGLVENILAINTQIGALILTPVGSSHFEPEFGSNLSYYIFDLPPVELNTWVMEDELLIAMKRWMPMVKVDFTRSKITMVPDGAEANYLFNLFYSVDGIDQVNIQTDFRFET